MFSDQRIVFLVYRQRPLVSSVEVSQGNPGYVPKSRTRSTSKRSRSEAWPCSRPMSSNQVISAPSLHAVHHGPCRTSCHPSKTRRRRKPHLPIPQDQGTQVLSLVSHPPSMVGWPSSAPQTNSGEDEKLRFERPGSGWGLGWNGRRRIVSETRPTFLSRFDAKGRWSCSEVKERRTQTATGNSGTCLTQARVSRSSYSLIWVLCPAESYHYILIYCR